MQFSFFLFFKPHKINIFLFIFVLDSLICQCPCSFVGVVVASEWPVVFWSSTLSLENVQISFFLIVGKGSPAKFPPCHLITWCYWFSKIQRFSSLGTPLPLSFIPDCFPTIAGRDSQQRGRPEHHTHHASNPLLLLRPSQEFLLISPQPRFPWSSETGAEPTEDSSRDLSLRLPPGRKLIAFSFSESLRKVCVIPPLNPAG